MVAPPRGAAPFTFDQEEAIIDAEIRIQTPHDFPGR